MRNMPFILLLRLTIWRRRVIHVTITIHRA